MVAGHKNAHAVSLVRWGSSELKGRDFTALITAISQARSRSRTEPANFGKGPLQWCGHKHRFCWGINNTAA